MATQPKNEYKKLSAGRYWFRNLNLWMGKDHLLLRESLGYSEDYKRFYFRDIQAILVRRHTQRLLWGLFWGTWLALMLVIMGATKDYKSVPLDIFAGLFLLFFIINLALGPGCVCRLKTAVQITDLPITRLRKAEKILARLKPIIEAAQTNLPLGPALVPEQPDPLTRSLNPSAAGGGSAPVKTLHTGAHWSLFLFLILSGGLDTTRFFTQDFTLYMMMSIFGFGTVIPLVFAMIRQSNSDISTGLRKATMGVMIFVIAAYFLGVIWGSSIGFKHPQIVRDQWAILKMGASISPYDSGMAMFDLVFDLAGSLLCAIFLLAALLNHQRARNSAPPTRQEAP